MKRLYLFILLIMTVLQVVFVSAQDSSTIDLTGTVTVIDETAIEVGGIRVDTTAVTDIVFEDGMLVTVSGNLEGGVVIAVTITVVTDTAEATPEVTPEMTPAVEVTPEVVSININIVIEGPVEAINVNVVTIYGLEIELDTHDIRTTVVQIGDRMHVRGHRRHRTRGPLVIVAVFYEFVGVDVIVVDGQLWRDYGDCAVIPPVWADSFTIHWHGRCDVIIINPGVPAGCRVTGMGGIKCTRRGSGMRGSGMR